MSKCDTCAIKTYGYLCDGCVYDESVTGKYTHMTNADHIRSMTDEELLGCLLELQDTAIKRFANFELPNYQWMADWLKQPYEEES